MSTEYNVRNASFNEISTVSKKLYQSGDISLAEHAILTFDYERATNDMIRIANGSSIYVSPNFSMYATEVKEMEKEIGLQNMRRELIETSNIIILLDTTTTRRC